jgi:AcrR family transcriptional regulator
MTELRATKRARNPEAKDERRADIVRAALELFTDHAYDRVTMAALARRTGLAKGTVYLYFGTKEAVFLGLLLDRLDEWFEALAPRLEAAPPEAPTRDLAGIFAHSLAERPELIRLLGLLHTTLERNIDVGLASEFKRRLAAQMARPGHLLEQRIAGFGEGDGVRLMMRMHALVVGIGQMAHPSEAVATALAQPELAVFRIDFERELTDVLEVLLRGWARAAA